MKKVSIIIPVYNVREYVVQCLESVVSQTLSNVQIICVNDGSDDGSEDIVRQYRERYPDKLVLIEQENAGLSMARNNGLKAVEGEYVLFLDSDDFFADETVVEKMYDKAKEDNLDLLAFNAVPVYDSEESERNDTEFKEYYKRSCVDGEVLPGTALLRKLEETHDYKTSGWLNMYRTNMIRNNHITFYPGIIHEDNAFTFLAFIYSLRAEYINQVYYIRRVRAGSIMTSNKSLKNVVGYTVACYQMLDRISGLEVEEADKESVIRRIQITLNNAAAILNTLSEDDIEGDTKKLDLQKRALLDVMVRNPKDKYYCIKSRLEQANDKINELNRKLQQTYAEKSEINAKLQQTYSEKAERGRQIRALTNDLQTERKKIEKQELNLEDCRARFKKLELRLKKKQEKYDELFFMYKKLEKRSIVCWFKKLIRRIKRSGAK